jgi:hypothetical protein
VTRVAECAALRIDERLNPNEFSDIQPIAIVLAVM